MQTDSRRLALFLAVSAAIVGAALAFALGGANPPPPSPATEHELAGAAALPPFLPRRPTAGSARPRGAVGDAARRFLPAFFRYEVGDLSPDVERALRDAATPSFAVRLLGAPSRAPASGGFPPRARLGRVEVVFVSASPPRAIVSGAADRDGAPEQFSFLFERRGSAWLASGPGQ